VFHAHYISQGSIVSAIGRGINAVLSAIVNVLETIINVIVTVRIVYINADRTSRSHQNPAYGR